MDIIATEFYQDYENKIDEILKIVYIKLSFVVKNI